MYHRKCAQRAPGGHLLCAFHKRVTVTMGLVGANSCPKGFRYCPGERDPTPAPTHTPTALPTPFPTSRAPTPAPTAAPTKVLCSARHGGEH